MIRKLTWIFFLITCSSPTFAEPLKVGALLDLSKTYAPQGQAFLRGIELAAEEVNKATPGSAEYFAEDTQFENINAVTAAQRLISQKKVAALITMTANEQKSVVLMAKGFKIPTVALWDSSPEVESLGEYSFGFGPWTPATGEKSAEFVLSYLKGKSAYIVTMQDEWSEHTGKYFEESFQKLGGKILGFDKLAADTSDFRSTISKIRVLKPDAIFFPLSKNLSIFLKQVGQQALPQMLVTADVLRYEEIKNSQGNAEGVYHLEAAAPESDKALKLFAKYKERYGSECELKQFVSWGYDAMLILADSWKRAGQKGGKDLADAIRNTKDLEVSAGKVYVSPGGSLPKFHVPSQVQNGKLVRVAN